MSGDDELIAVMAAKIRLLLALIKYLDDLLRTQQGIVDE